MQEYHIIWHSDDKFSIGDISCGVNYRRVDSSSLMEEVLLRNFTTKKGIEEAFQSGRLIIVEGYRRKVETREILSVGDLPIFNSPEVNKEDIFQIRTESLKLLENVTKELNEVLDKCHVYKDVAWYRVADRTYYKARNFLNTLKEG